MFKIYINTPSLIFFMLSSVLAYLLSQIYDLCILLWRVFNVYSYLGSLLSSINSKGPTVYLYYKLSIIRILLGFQIKYKSILNTRRYIIFLLRKKYKIWTTGRIFLVSSCPCSTFDSKKFCDLVF